jgi:ribonuclease G
LRWFRSRKSEEKAPSEAAAPEAPEPVSTEPAGEAGQSSSTRPRRRRGSRGGRGRSKKTATAAVKTEASEPKTKTATRTERKPATQRRERERPQQRRRREPPRRAPLPQAKRELLVSVDVGEQRVAVLEDDRVAEVYLERPERRSIAGDIYLGTVDNVLPGMEAAFIEIGLEKNGFLYVDEIVTPELEGKARHGKKIQDLISRGQTIMVQAVKDPMKTKGARLTTEISLPGRFVVYQPNGDGFGVSRRLDDEERSRLKDVLKALDLKGGGVIVRTAAEGASAEDIERDLLFLQKLWKSIDGRAKKSKPPTLLYQEAELPLRVTRDLFTENFERALVDEDRAYKRIVGYLKKTSPHMVERVVRYKDKPPLMEAYGVDAEIKSTLSRRVDLPSGGYLIFDYAEAFTVIDVNTGRFVGSRSKSSGARLEDTITKNNLEAVKEVVRQLRLRDIGGIIVIDFIDMANPKNRATVEGALRTELERDRTKTYVVEISPLGLVEMTRQNVTDGPREIMTKKCPTCGGDGIVLSETSAAVEIERRLRALAGASRHQAYRVEVAAKVASILIGPGAARLQELEKQTRRRFYPQPKEDTHLDHFLVLAEGKREELAPASPVAEGAKIELKLVEVGRHDAAAGVGKLDGLDVSVANAAKQVGKKVDVQVERVLDDAAYATLVSQAVAPDEPITAESEAEKPTRRAATATPPTKTAELDDPELAEEDEEEEDELEADELEADEHEADERDAEAVATADGEPTVAPKKKTRRGSRGGRGRKKKTAAAPAAAGNGSGEPEDVAPPAATRIHVPDPDLGESDESPDEPAGDGTAPPRPKKKTRRGTRGGRGRKKKTTAAAVATGTDGSQEAGLPEEETASESVEETPSDAEEQKPSATEEEKASDWEYVPMSKWDDDLPRA